MNDENIEQLECKCEECSCFKSCKRICLDETLKNLTVKCVCFEKLKKKLNR